MIKNFKNGKAHVVPVRVPVDTVHNIRTLYKKRIALNRNIFKSTFCLNLANELIPNLSNMKLA